MARKEEPELVYQFRVAAQDDGTYAIWFPDLPGCSTSATSVDEIGPVALEVMQLWIESEVEQGRPLPDMSKRPDVLWPHEAYLVDEEEAPSYLLARDIASQLGVTERRVSAIAQRRGIGTMVGRLRLFRPDDIEALRPGPVGRPSHRANAIA
ncbi:MAG TPA: type II toxin-antitoxin system HicB family antitoxin [Thermomicrobiales bacterium]|jgi:predicted RNase H-like HicB family nuclease|nr:type II toxin-antitoxin system HicB family antitoxin [Thermomicrobiales bacterium]